VDPVTAKPFLDPLAQLGIVGSLCLVLALVVRQLFKEFKEAIAAKAAGDLACQKERESAALAQLGERNAWIVERERLRTELEIKLREQSEKLASQLGDTIKQCREAESATRREFADMLEGMSAEQQKSNTAQVAVIDKLTERIISGGRGA